jgi:hypothetical protein
VSILTVLTELATCLCGAISDDDGPNVCWCGVVPGSGGPPVDLVGEGKDGSCGVGYVQLGLAYPSDQVGVQAVVPGSEPTGTGLDVNVGILRTMDLDGEIPEEAVLLEALERQVADIELIRKAILCCDAVSARDMILGIYTPHGPDGGVVGGYWTVHIGIL